jgi:hypothetical protein
MVTRADRLQHFITDTDPPFASVVVGGAVLGGLRDNMPESRP